MPTDSDSMKPSTTDCISTAVGHPKIRLTTADPPNPQPPPTGLRKAYGGRLQQELNQYLAFLGAQRLPYGYLLMRSVTDTSMMFMIPMPPTK